MSWIDSFLIGVSTVSTNGIAAIKERGLNLIAGSGVTITATDNPGNGRVDITITSTGGSGAVPTGTGFYAVVSGVMTAAARAVNLASSDITGILAAANQAAQTMAGDVVGTTAANTISGVNPPSSALATAPNITFNSPASTNTNGTPGAIVLNVPAATGTGKQNGAQFQYGGNFYAYIGPPPGVPSYSALYLLPSGTAPSAANNLTIATDGGSTYINSPSSGGTIYFYTAFTALYGAFINGAGLKLYSNTPQLLFDVGVTTPGIVAAAGNLLVKTVSTGTINTANPIIGSSADASPYGVHGDVAISLTGSTALTAAQYAQNIFQVTPSASGYTLSGFPRAATGAGYSKLVFNSSSFSFTLSDGTHSSTVPATPGLYVVAFTNAAVAVK